MRIGIVAGHTGVAGKDQGAQGYVNEGKKNREKALACYNALRNYQCTPFLEPEGYPLNDEIAWVNRNRLDLAVAMHNNAGGGDGWEALVSVTGSTLKLARQAEAEIKKLGQNSRGIKQKRNSSGTDWYGFLRMTNCPAIIFETAFVDNKDDVKFIDTNAKNRAIGKAYAKAIAKTYGLVKKSDSAASSSQSKSEVRYRTQGSVRIQDSNGKTVGWTKRDQVLKGTLDGRWLRIAPGRYVNVSPSTGVLRMKKYWVVRQTYYRASSKWTVPVGVAKVGDIIWAVPYSRWLRLGRGKYLPKNQGGKAVVREVK